MMFSGESKKKIITPFYGWGPTASRLESLRGGTLLFTTNSKGNIGKKYKLIEGDCGCVINLDT